jgi:alpha-galactosidase
VSEDCSEALVGCYKLLNQTNVSDIRFRLYGLSENMCYQITSRPKISYYGDELMNAGLIVDEREFCAGGADFSSVLYELKGSET